MHSLAWWDQGASHVRELNFYEHLKLEYVTSLFFSLLWCSLRKMPYSRFGFNCRVFPLSTSVIWKHLFARIAAATLLQMFCQILHVWPGLHNFTIEHYHNSKSVHIPSLHVEWQKDWVANKLSNIAWALNCNMNIYVYIETKKNGYIHDNRKVKTAEEIGRKETQGVSQLVTYE